MLLRTAAVVAKRCSYARSLVRLIVLHNSQTLLWAQIIDRLNLLRSPMGPKTLSVVALELPRHPDYSTLLRYPFANLEVVGALRHE